MTLGRLARANRPRHMRGSDYLLPTLRSFDRNVHTAIGHHYRTPR
jgi:hypothetical protein